MFWFLLRWVYISMVGVFFLDIGKLISGFGFPGMLTRLTISSIPEKEAPHSLFLQNIKVCTINGVTCIDERRNSGSPQSGHFRNLLFFVFLALMAKPRLFAETCQA